MSFHSYYRIIKGQSPQKILKISLRSFNQILRDEGEWGILGDLTKKEAEQGPLICIGEWMNTPLVVLYRPDADEESCLSLRDFLDHDNAFVPPMVIRASEMLSWYVNHRFCGHCGGDAEPLKKEPAMVCKLCGHRAYPVLSPAVMVRIEKQNKILLAHNRNFQNKTFSLIAGFVDPGETLEEAVHREVMEEVGLEVQNLRYFHSQSWPMPHTLLVGFIADYKGGDIRPDGEEITEALWAGPDQDITLPGKGSLAYEMISDAFGKS